MAGMKRRLRVARSAVITGFMAKPKRQSRASQGKPTFA
jgi:hypothetical protein